MYTRFPELAWFFMEIHGDLLKWCAEDEAAKADGSYWAEGAAERRADETPTSDPSDWG